MRAAGQGRIINISSIGGKMYEPLGAWYHATKFAVEGLSDSLRLELKPHGIEVAIIEPAGTLSEWGAISAEGLLASSGNGPYRDQAKVDGGGTGVHGNAGNVDPAGIMAEAWSMHARPRRGPRRATRWAGAPGDPDAAPDCCRTGCSTPRSRRSSSAWAAEPASPEA